MKIIKTIFVLLLLSTLFSTTNAQEKDKACHFEYDGNNYVEVCEEIEPYNVCSTLCW